jgi:ABC-type glycerol-3-phosphate transport system substrate-binding protein
MEAAGLPHTREDFMKEATWDHMQQWAEIIRDKNKADGVWGIGTWQVYHQSLGAIYQSIATDLYYDDGLIKFDSEEMIRAFEIQAKWSWSEVAPTPAWGSEPFIKGKAGLWQGQVGVVGTAQRVWGKQDIPVPLPVLVEPTGTGGNQWYTTCGFVLNKAEHPQEVVDFYLWMFGPQNDLNAQLTLDFNWFPVFQSQWDKQVEGNADREWAKDFLPQLKEAELVPRNPYYEIQVAASRKYCELCQAQKVTPKEAAQQCMEEVRQGVSELKIEW